MRNMDFKKLEGDANKILREFKKRFGYSEPITLDTLLWQDGSYQITAFSTYDHEDGGLYRDTLCFKRGSHENTYFTYLQKFVSDNNWDTTLPETIIWPK